jgi:CheY-like chemotaxis protein
MFASPSLLITDDNRDFRETLRGVFEPHGFRTLLAADGEEAIQIVRANRIHVVLMDLQMPRLSGLEAIARIKEVDADLPCILISAALDDRIRNTGEAFSVLSKPVNYEEVTRTVQAAMRLAYTLSVSRHPRRAASEGGAERG